jgi:ATP-dependent Lon protease
LKYNPKIEIIIIYKDIILYIIMSSISECETDSTYVPSENVSCGGSWDEENVINELRRNHPKLHEKFIETREYLATTSPSIEIILETPMYLKDRAEIVELFEMFTLCEPLTFDWLDLKNEIKTKIEKYTAKYLLDQSIDLDIRKKVENELNMLKDLNEQSTEFKIALLNIPLHYKNTLYCRYKMLESDPDSDDSCKITEWVSTVLKVPFGIYLQIKGENIIMNLKNHLDKEFYGLENVKEQILIYVNNRINNQQMKNYPLGLIGSPGTGKTQISLAISQALDVPFQQLSGGGLIDHNNIHGHSYTYVGSQPGDIVNSLIKMKCLNGILFIDEFDKIPLEKNLNGLLQIIDPIQNHNFKDNYIGDIPIDLSRLWYILSMNSEPSHTALSDRIFIVQIPSYTHKQKILILKNHTIPKLLRDSGVNITFTDEVLQHIVYTTDGDGMRQCIHLLNDIICKLLFIKHNPTIRTSFSVDLPKNNIIDMSIINKIVSTKESDYNTMYM